MASYRTPPVDEKPFGGFSYSLGTQNLLVTESREDECQILSTAESDDRRRDMRRLFPEEWRCVEHSQWVGKHCKYRGVGAPGVATTTSLSTVASSTSSTATSSEFWLAALSDSLFGLLRPKLDPVPSNTLLLTYSGAWNSSGVPPSSSWEAIVTRSSCFLMCLNGAQFFQHALSRGRNLWSQPQTDTAARTVTKITREQL